jgi:hypothetical protein
MIFLALAVVAFGTIPACAASATTTTLSVTANGLPVTTVPAETVVTLTATVNSGANIVRPGTVNFCDVYAAHCTDIHMLGTAQITTSGTAVYRFKPGPGVHSYKAVFVGTNSYSASSSAASSLTVPGNGATILVASGVPGNYTLTESIPGNSSSTPQGSVSFVDTTNVNYLLGSAQLAPSGFGFINSTPPAGVLPSSLVVGDFNNDGIPDIAVADIGNFFGTSGNGISILLGNGDGTFALKTSFPTPGSSYGIIADDFNNDGNLDIVFVNYKNNTSSPVSVFLGNGDGTFTTAPALSVGAQATGVVSGDFNHDGQLDLAVTIGNYNVTIFLGNGDGTFTALASTLTTSLGPLRITVGDFNNDGNADLAVADASSKINIFLGNGDGTFISAATLSTYPGDVSSIVAADLNGDGNLDLAVSYDVSAAYKDTVSIYLGDGTGAFSLANTLTLNGYAYDLAVGDLNIDGVPDLAVVDIDKGVIDVLLGKGDGTFTLSPNSPTDTYDLYAAAVADFNGDGLPDIAVTNGLSNNLSIFITQPTNSSTATLTGVSVVGTGTHYAQGLYPGDANFPASDSNLVPLIAQPEPTTLTLAVAPTNITLGQKVTLTATLAPDTAQNHTATGSVTFTNNGNPIGTAPLAAGPSTATATLDIKTLPAGTDQISCTYPGDTNFATSTCNTVPVTVTGKPTTITLTSNNNPAYTYQNVTFTVKTTASGTGPLSPITLTSNGVLLTTLTPTTDTTKYTSAFDTPGTYAIVATFAGNATQAPSSGTLSQVVTLRPSTVGLVVTPAKVLVGQPVTLTATTVGLKPTEHPAGKLTFYDGTTSLGTFKLVKGVATLTTSTLAPGPHSLTCTYLGSKRYAGSNCNVVPYIVYAPATVALTATPGVVFVGNPVALGASVTSTYATPTGMITFLDGTNPLGTVMLAASGTNTSSAGLTTTTLALGTHTITAAYSGDSNFAPATSPPVTVLVEDLAFAISPNPLTIHHGGTGVFTLNLNALGGPVIASPVTFTIAGNPDHSPVTFSPTTVPATAASAAATLTIATPDYPVGPWSSLREPGLHKPTYSRAREITLAMFGLGALLLPFTRRSRSKLQRLTAMLLFVAVSILLGTTSGCGSGWGNQSYHITVTATSGNLSRSATATLITQP